MHRVPHKKRHRDGRFPGVQALRALVGEEVPQVLVKAASKMFDTQTDQKKNSGSHPTISEQEPI